MIMTQKNKLNRLLNCVLSFVLVAALALSLTACSSTPDAETTAPASPAESVESTAGSTEVGEGAHSFTFTSTDLDGKKTVFAVKTDEKTVGAALVKLGIIAGDESQYGLYVKTVNGVTLDYDKDGAYWAFYVNDAYAEKGVDSTDIVDGASYAFTATKG